MIDIYAQVATAEVHRLAAEISTKNTEIAGLREDIAKLSEGCAEASASAHMRELALLEEIESLREKLAALGA